MKKGRRVSVSSTAVSNGMQGNAWMSQYLFSTKTKDQQEEAKVGVVQGSRAREL